MPRTPPRYSTTTRPGYIPLPKNMEKLGWKVEVIGVDGTTSDITNDLAAPFTIERIATDGLSSFTILVDNTEGKYRNKFAAGNAVNIYYDFKDFSSQNVIRFRGYLDGAYDGTGANGWALSLEGRDAPPSSNNEHFGDTQITIQFSTETNILDCWIGTSGTADDEGNMPDGVLYNSGLIMKIYDTSDNTFKNYKDLSSEQKDTLKAQSGYTSTHIDSHIEKTRLSISKILADDGNYDFRIFYDSNDQNSYLYIHPRGVIVNQSEFVTLGQNFIDLPRFGRDTLTEANRFKQKGFSDGDILLMRTKEDTASQSALWIKDKVETSSALGTMAEVTAKAIARLSQLKESGKSGILITTGLPTLQPAEKFRLMVPYVINDEVLSKSFTIVCGPGVGLEFMHNILKREATLQQLFKDRINENVANTPSDNPNGHRNSLFFDFSDSTDYILGDSQINNQILTLISGSSEGICTTISPPVDANVTSCELRVKANQYFNCTYRVRNTLNDSDWVSIALNESITFTTTGNNLQLEISLKQSTSGSSPEFQKAELLYT